MIRGLLCSIASVSLLSACSTTNALSLAPPVTVAGSLPVATPAVGDVRLPQDDEAGPTNPIVAKVTNALAPSQQPPPGAALRPAEATYARATAAGIFRRRASERSTGFVSAGNAAGFGTGYGICLRSPSLRTRGYDYALIVLPHRLNGEEISQVDDETVVLRRFADTAVCRQPSVVYVASTRR